MKKLILIIFIFSTIEILACCSSKSYRLFPIGELNNSVVFIEFNSGRACKKGIGVKENSEYWVYGDLNLVISKNNKLIKLQELGEIEKKECVSSYKNHFKKSKYEKIFKKHYLKALNVAKKMKGFKIAKTKSIIFNDTKNLKLSDDKNPFYKRIKYKNILNIKFDQRDVLDCLPDKVAEVKSYETANFEVVVTKLDCKETRKEVIKDNSKKFKKLETAFWKEDISWHGISKDYYFIKKKLPTPN